MWCSVYGTSFKDNVEVMVFVSASGLNSTLCERVKFTFMEPKLRAELHVDVLPPKNIPSFGAKIPWLHPEPSLALRGGG